MSFIFLMCSERSGSNFITKLFNGHSNICGPSTKHLINPVARNIFRYKDLNVLKNWDLLLEDIHRLLSVKFSIWEKNFTIDELKYIAPVGDISALLKNIFYAEAKANNKQHVFIKENQLYEFLPFLLHHFPDAKYIYQTRDPRDMALSWKKNFAFKGGVVSAANQWKKDQQNFLKDNYVLQQSNNVFHVKYEDLISKTQHCIKEIVNFLGIPYEADIINFYKDDLTQKNSLMQDSWSNLSKEVIPDNKNKYLNELTTDEIKAIEKICFYEMNRLGYFTHFSENELQQLSFNDVSILEQQDHLNKEEQKSDAILANMEAKKRFYQTIID